MTRRVGERATAELDFVTMFSFIIVVFLQQAKRRRSDHAHCTFVASSSMYHSLSPLFLPLSCFFSSVFITFDSPTDCTLMARVKAATYTTTFFWPIFWRQNGHDTGRVANSFLWLHPTLALAKYRHQGEQIKFFIFPLVHIRHDGIRRTFSLLWFAFPQFAMFRVVKENGETIIRYWWPIYYHSAIVCSSPSLPSSCPSPASATLLPHIPLPFPPPSSLL